jgi:hypothetical protein
MDRPRRFGHGKDDVEGQTIALPTVSERIIHAGSARLWFACSKARAGQMVCREPAGARGGGHGETIAGACVAVAQSVHATGVAGLVPHADVGGWLLVTGWLERAGDVVLDREAEGALDVVGDLTGPALDPRVEVDGALVGGLCQEAADGTEQDARVTRSRRPS